jgi:hypothetical protein
VQERTTTVRATITCLRSLVTIRKHCQQMFELACTDRLHHFVYHSEKLPAVAHGATF